MIRIGVAGANGRMGKEAVNMVFQNPEYELVMAVDKNGAGKKVFDIETVPDFTTLKEINPDIIIDFTQPDAVFENIKIYQKNKIKSVIGTTGLTKEQITQAEIMSKENSTGIIIAPNFSIGAVLMMKFSKIAAKYFSNAEIIEFHHNQKKDAPSGTALKTAQLMIENNDNFKQNNCMETETLKGARGGEFVRGDKGKIQIHSVRMPGFVASQEVIFGSDGQTLKIHHDTINRSCYMPGVSFAVDYLYRNNQFIYGLENII